MANRTGGRGFYFLVLVLLVSTHSFAQYPPIGIIDFYGLRKVSADEVRNLLGIQEGDTLPPSEAADLERRLAGIPGDTSIHVFRLGCIAQPSRALH